MSGSFCTLCVLRVGVQGWGSVCFWEFFIFGVVVGETVIINKGASSAVVLVVVEGASPTIFHVFWVE